MTKLTMTKMLTRMRKFKKLKMMTKMMRRKGSKKTKIWMSNNA